MAPLKNMPPRRLMVDVVAQVISMVPAPYLQPAVETFKIILSRLDQAQANKRQIRAIAQTVAQILLALNSRSSGTWIEDKWMLKTRYDFEELLSRIANFCAKNARKKFVRSFLDAAEDQGEINIIHTQLNLSVDSFQISSQVSIQNYNNRIEVARLEDQAEINVSLKQLHKKQDTLLALMGQPSIEHPSLDQSAHHDPMDSASESVGSQKTIFGLLGDIQDTVKSPNNSEILQEVLVELRKVSTIPTQPPPTDQNPIVANLKPGLAVDVLIAPLKWQMNSVMRKEQLTRHLDLEQTKKFRSGTEGSKDFVEYLVMTDDISLQYAALEFFRKDKTVKHFFKP